MTTPRNQRAEQTRQKILEATFAIIREEGFPAVSANRITEVAGISKGGFFHHFPTVDDLYLYLLETLIERIDVDLDPASFKDFRAYFTFTTEYMIRFVADAPEMITIIFYFISQSRHNADYHSRIRAMMETSFAAWADKIAFFFHKPLKKRQREGLIRLIDLYFVGFSFHLLMMDDAPRYRALSEEFCTMIINTYDHQHL